jgi:hypothetical protein
MIFLFERVRTWLAYSMCYIRVAPRPFFFDFFFAPRAYYYHFFLPFLLITCFSRRIDGGLLVIKGAIPFARNKSFLFPWSFARPGGRCAIVISGFSRPDIHLRFQSTSNHPLP